MINRLKHKMLGTIMFFISIIIITFLIVINVVPSQTAYNEAISFLNQNILPATNTPPKPDANITPDNKTAWPNDSAMILSPPRNDAQHPSDDTMLFHSNLISIYLDDEGNITKWVSNREDLYEDATITELAKTVYENKKKEGTVSGYYYVYRTFADNSTIALLDNRITFHNFRTTLFISILAGIFVWILLFILSAFIVNRMTYPIAETFEKQRQFISDAGHELKTPVAVISANADVLSKEIGENKWLSYIQTETKRMDNLIKNLMTLAQIDDSDKKYVQTRINISQTVLGAALPLESLAFENGTIMEFDIDPELYIWGNKEQIEQLVIILLSNAMKYGKERGYIRISLHKQHKSVLLSVYNTGSGIKPDEKEKIFERFYRVEKERSRKDGNYGLGLAIAKSIVLDHHGKISVESEYGKNATFNIEFMK